jgi:hypothetical protein
MKRSTAPRRSPAWRPRSVETLVTRSAAAFASPIIDATSCTAVATSRTSSAVRAVVDVIAWELLSCWRIDCEMPAATAATCSIDSTSLPTRSAIRAVAAMMPCRPPRTSSVARDVRVASCSPHGRRRRTRDRPRRRAQLQWWRSAPADLSGRPRPRSARSPARWCARLRSAISHRPWRLRRHPAPRTRPMRCAAHPRRRRKALNVGDRRRHHIHVRGHTLGRGGRCAGAHVRLRRNGREVSDAVDIRVAWSSSTRTISPMRL